MKRGVEKKIGLIIFGILLLQFFTTVPAHAVHKTYDMSIPANYNLRIDGAGAGNRLALYGAFLVADLDLDGKEDLIIGSGLEDYNSLSNSGSIYIIFDYKTRFAEYSGTGNIIDLYNSDNYDLRIDGGASEIISYNSIIIVDIDDTGLPDLAIPAPGIGMDGRSNCGGFYVIYNSLLNSYEDKYVSLSNPDNYSLKVYGAGSGHYLGISSFLTGDLDNDGRPDIVIASNHTNYGFTKAGSVYVIYNSLLSTYAGKEIDLNDLDNFSLRIDGPVNTGSLAFRQNAQSHDLDNDLKHELIISSAGTDYNGRTDSGSLYIISNVLLQSFSSKTVSLTSESNYSLRIDGAVAGHRFPVTEGVKVADINNDGRNDLIAGTIYASYNGFTASGSVYVIFNSLLNSYDSKHVDLNDSDNYSLRFDGASEREWLGDLGVEAADFNNDGKVDLFLGGIQADCCGISKAGVTYIIYNWQIQQYSSKFIDLSDQSNYALRYHGSEVHHQYLKRPSPFDLNGNGKLDLVLIASKSNYNGRVESGSIVIPYNFPHTFSTVAGPSVTNDNMPTFSGNLVAPNSVTNISDIQYSLNNPSFGAVGWTSCTPGDGNFNSTDESYSCSPGTVPDGTHKLYLRAYDENISYTAQSNYVEREFTVDTVPPQFFNLSDHSSPINLVAGQKITANPYIIRVKPQDVTTEVAYVEFYVDDNLLCSVSTTNANGEYECAWDTSLYQSAVRVIAYDLAGNSSVLGVEAVLVGTGEPMIAYAMLSGMLILAPFATSKTLLQKTYIQL